MLENPYDSMTVEQCKAKLAEYEKRIDAAGKKDLCDILTKEEALQMIQCVDYLRYADKDTREQPVPDISEEDAIFLLRQFSFPNEDPRVSRKIAKRLKKSHDQRQ